jgi:hypothetical protein
VTSQQRTRIDRLDNDLSRGNDLRATVCEMDEFQFVAPPLGPESSVVDSSTCKSRAKGELHYTHLLRVFGAID